MLITVAFLSYPTYVLFNLDNLRPKVGFDPFIFLSSISFLLLELFFFLAIRRCLCAEWSVRFM